MIDAFLEIFESSQALATIIVGVAGFGWHSWNSQKFMKRQHTFNVVSNFTVGLIIQNRIAKDWIKKELQLRKG